MELKFEFQLSRGKCLRQDQSQCRAGDWAAGGILESGPSRQGSETPGRYLDNNVVDTNDNNSGPVASMKVILCKCTKCATLDPAMTRFPEKLWMEGREGARGGAADLPTSSEYLVIVVPGIQISALCWPVS